MIDIGEGQFVAYGHFQSGSITVSVGQRVRSGQLVGLVGNSGNSDEPHLQVHAQNNSTFDVHRPPAGLATHPVEIRRGSHVLSVHAGDLRSGDRFATTG